MTHQLLTRTILNAAFEVSNTLGSGFLEKVYHRALAHELTLRHLHVISEQRLTILYKGQTVGDYLPDLLIENKILIELKCADRLAPEHTAQCINYLRATNLEVCLLLNFQHPKLEYRRVVNDPC